MQAHTKAKTNGDEQWFEALFSYATIGIIVTDKKGFIINFNKQAERDFGYKKEEIISKPIETLLPAAVKMKHEHYRADFYAHPSPRAMGHGRDLFAQKKDGSVFPVEVSLSNYEVNSEIFVIAFVIDITVRKDHEQMVIKQKEELERITSEIKQLNSGLEKKVEDRTKMLRETLSALEKSKLELSDALKVEKDLGELKSRFVSMASHEFKTPLSTILSSAFLLEKYNSLDEPEKRAKHISRIKNAVNDMRLILDDFLSLDKLDEGLIQTSMENIPAIALFGDIRNTINEIQVNCKPGQTIQFEHNGSAAVCIDKHLLKNIFINLMSNAIKFSPEHSVIHVYCTINETGLVLSIQDHGIGISEEDLQHLFQRFFRAKNAFNIQGTGLGLHIVTKYLELMNGTIKIDSRLNEGSTFTIYIPQIITA
ncbi:ATP-binding protein [Parafilimonas sp.]|uniref:PAS domain-containing sensor histidine kinase n=1 Tax=Parafilimonas sp. TaxID=1969739 RepID=UPI0039E5751F